jgi:hypothetical protein
MAAQFAGEARRSPAALVAQARELLADAAATDDAVDRFRLAHLAALRTAAAVVADRARPTTRRPKLVSVWLPLQRVAPDLAPWARSFAAAAPVRAAAEAGALSAVSQGAADDQLRSAAEFLAEVEGSLGMLAA